VLIVSSVINPMFFEGVMLKPSSMHDYDRTGCSNERVSLLLPTMTTPFTRMNATNRGRS